MSCPAFTIDPRSTLMESTNPLTFGKTATSSYGCNSPGSRTVMANLRDSTGATSTTGVCVAAVCAFAFDSGDAELPPQEAQSAMVPERANARNRVLRVLIYFP